MTDVTMTAKYRCGLLIETKILPAPAHPAMCGGWVKRCITWEVEGIIQGVQGCSYTPMEIPAPMKSVCVCVCQVRTVRRSQILKFIG